MRYHYKDRHPRKTIKIINNFFKERGYTLKSYLYFKTEIGTFSHHCELWYKNRLIELSNGKGLTSALSKASAYAEMYERFCNYNSTNIFNPIFLSRYRQINPTITNNDNIDIINDASYNDFCNETFECWDTCKEDLYHLVTKNDSYNLPFTNILTGEKKYYDPRVLIMLNSTTGMSAGNSFEEAFIQGLSEIFERYFESLILNKKITNFKEIDLQTIPSLKIKKIINNILKLNMEIHLYDLASETSLPGVYAILINKEKHYALNKFASFPKLEVSIERIITELWQGVKTFNDCNDEEFFQIPTTYKDNPQMKESFTYYTNVNKRSKVAYVNERLFENSELVSYKQAKKNYNCSKSLSNYNFCLQLIKQKDLEVLVKDNSISDKMFALHLYIPSFYISNLSVDQKISQSRFCYAAEYISEMSKFYLQGIIDNKIIETNRVKPVSLTEYNFIGSVLYDSFFHFFGNNVHTIYGESNYKSFYMALANLDKNELFKSYNTIFYSNLKKYFLLLNYINSGGYTNNELKSFFSKLNLTITDEDIKNYNNGLYLMEQIYFKPANKLMNSNEFDEYMETYKILNN